MSKKITTLAAGVLLLLVSLTAPAHAWTCSPRLGNGTPCQVTHKEWQKVKIGMDRREAVRLLGVHGHRVNWYWHPEDGWFHVVVEYPTGTQDVTWVDYRDVGDRGVFTVWSKGWDYERIPVVS